MELFCAVILLATGTDAHYSEEQTGCRRERRVRRDETDEGRVFMEGRGWRTTVAESKNAGRVSEASGGAGRFVRLQNSGSSSFFFFFFFFSFFSFCYWT